MCFLCGISRWSRRIASMLPWLVIPFIIVWALSQLLPPSYRLEVTSSRLACLGVLLLSLLWYEILMPSLSSWRAHRSALLRERKLIEALEAAKWRKEATRRCRNCLTAYKVQMPGSGRYVCTYCGHISKRPVLEVAGALASSKLVAPGPLLGNNATGMLHLKSACQGNGPLAAWSRAAERNRCTWFGEGSHTADRCSVEQSLPAPLLFISRMLSLLWKTLLGLGHSTSDGSRDLRTESENIDDFNRVRGEKARKKADKKKQARLQKELLEAEDKKQREEVALLVEERRRLRDELEVAKQKEREADAEKARERRGRDNEKRMDKASNRAGTDGPLGQAQEQVVRAIQKTTGKATVPRGVSKEQVAESSTIEKLSRGTVQDRASRYRNTMDSVTRLGFLKRTGIRSAGSASKTPQDDSLSRGKKDGAHVLGKSTTISVGSSSSSPKAAGAPHVPDSAWKRTPWLSAWVRGSKGVTRDGTETQTESIFDNRKQNLDGLKSSNNYALIGKPSLSPVRGTTIQPPIAPPSIHVDPLQQLFSTPSLFSPMDLCVNVNNQFDQKSQSETKGVFLPEHTFFEAHNYSQSSSFASPFASPLQMPMPVLDTISTSSQPTLGVSGSSFLQSNAAVPQRSVHFDSLYDGEPALAVGTTIESPPFNSSRTSDSVIKETLIPPSLLGSLKVTVLDSHTAKVDCSPWDSADEEALQLPPLSTVHSLFDSERSPFDSETLTHDTYSLSLQKMGNLKANEDVLVNGMQGLEERSFTSAFDSAAHIWDDADGSQKVPAEFVDCITQEIMEDPVITADGHSYERTAIEKWLKHHDTSPKTGEVLPPPPGSSGVDKTLRPNHILRGQIIEYKERLARMSELRSMTWSVSDKDAGRFFKMAGSPSVLSF